MGYRFINYEIEPSIPGMNFEDCSTGQSNTKKRGRMSSTPNKLDTISKNHQNLTSQVIKGSAWMVSLRIVTRGVNVIVTIILARLLSPEDFGLVAIGVLAISLFKVFTETGLKEAMIKESSVIEPSMLNTAWTVEVIRGVIITSIIMISAPDIANFFNSPGSIQVIRALGISPLIFGLTNVKIIYLQKHLEFNKQFLYEISLLFGPLFVSIPLAFILQNVWALVFGTLAGNFFQFVISYLLKPYIPKPEINIVHFKRLFTFGKWILAGSIVSYFAMEFDTYAVAKIFDPIQLGIYVMAFSIANKPIIEIGKALGKVFFPAFSIISHDKQRLKNAFLKSSFLLYATLLPFAVGLSFVANDLTNILLGEKWLEIIPVLQILAIGTMFRSLALPSNSIFKGIGKPNLVFILAAGRMLVLVVIILALNQIVEISLILIAKVVLLSNIAVFLIFAYYLYKHVDINLKDWLAFYYPLFLSVFNLFISLFVIKIFISEGLIRFILLILSGGVIYFSTYIILVKYFNAVLVKSIFKSIKPRI